MSVLLNLYYESACTATHRVTAMQTDGGRTAKRMRPIRGGIGRTIVEGQATGVLAPYHL